LWTRLHAAEDRMCEVDQESEVNLSVFLGFEWQEEKVDVERRKGRV